MNKSANDPPRVFSAGQEELAADTIAIKKEEVEVNVPEDNTIDNLELPKSIVFKLAKAALPEGTLIQKDAKQVLTRVATFFVSYLGATVIESAGASSSTSTRSKSSEKQAAPAKVTLTPASIINALRDMDFDNLVKPLNLLMIERRKNIKP